MKIKLPNRLAYKFLLPIILVILARAVIVDIQTQNAARQVLLDQASTQLADIVRLQASLNGITPDDFKLPRNDKLAAQKFATIYNQIHTKDVVRMKVWDATNTIVYSDAGEMIGENFGSNPDLQQALASGNAQTKITQPDATENIDVRSFPQLMEIYVPITLADGAQAPGAIEIYYRLNGLQDALSNFESGAGWTIVASMAVAATVLVTTLYFTVLRPLRALQRATSRVIDGHLNTVVLAKGSDEIAELSRSFNKMIQGLKELERLRKEFVFVAAHELRAPVSVIRGYLSMSENGESTKTNALHQISQANQRLEQLVNDLLDIARADAGKLKFSLSPIDLTKIVYETVTFFTPLAQEKHMAVAYHQPHEHYTIMADERRMKEVLTNLVSNAVKYGDEHTSVEVYYEVKSNEVTAFVKNAGDGISPEAQKHMFEKFYRAPEAEASAVLGSGLGLFITKELVERMGGSIGFMSEVGRGTTFYVTFKLADTNDKIH